MAANVGFILKHPFPNNEALRVKGFAAIHVHHGHSMVLMKDILHSLTNSFELINLILGTIPGSPLHKKTGVNTANDCQYCQ
jgi:hypothetical protein